MKTYSRSLLNCSKTRASTCQPYGCAWCAALCLPMERLGDELKSLEPTTWQNGNPINKNKAQDGKLSKTTDKRKTGDIQQ